MKQKQTKHRMALMLLTLLFSLAAVFQLQARIRLESKDKAVAVVMLAEDVRRLSEAGDESIDQWYRSLADTGLSAVIVPSEQLQNHEVIDPIQEAGLEIAQLGGDGAPGLYFAPVEYDVQISKGKTQSAEVAPSSTGRVWTMVENNPQTGCVLPDGFDVTAPDMPWVKGFYLRQNVRSRSVATELDDAQEVGDILFRAVADRGVQVLWIAPLGDEDGLNTDPQTYANLLTRLQSRIERCGLHYGLPQGLEALELSPAVLILCGLGIFAGAVLLLCLLFPIRERIAWILYAVCALECIASAVLRQQLQQVLLAFGASVVFPALSICYLGSRLTEAKEQSHASFPLYMRAVLIGTLITVLGGCYIGAVLGNWRYILVLQVFRGVKLSQIAVYLFAFVLLGWMLLELRKFRNLKSLLPSVDRRLLVRVVSVIVIFVGVGMIYLMRGGDGMLGVSALESRIRAALENWVLYRPRTKEFLIAWPAIALAFCFAARKDRLFAWLFGVLGGIGFASVANTFCHIRAHFLVSVARTAIGLILGLLIGSLFFILFRPSKE